MICSGSSCRYSMARMAASVPSMPRQRRPGHKPCLPRMKRRAVSVLMVSMMTSWSKIGTQARGLPPLGSNLYHGDCNILQRERAISMILHDSTHCHVSQTGRSAADARGAEQTGAGASAGVFRYLHLTSIDRKLNERLQAVKPALHLTKTFFLIRIICIRRI